MFQETMTPTMILAQMISLHGSHSQSVLTPEFLTPDFLIRPLPAWWF